MIYSTLRLWVVGTNGRAKRAKKNKRGADYREIM
jgi:hypothetical protein